MYEHMQPGKKRDAKERGKKKYMYMYIPAERKRENEQSKVGYINELACG